MRVLVLGGTGSIGSAVLTELLAAGHDVLALARSEHSAALMATRGAKILHGDIRNPAGWVSSVPKIDAVIHAATDFSDEMDAIDRRLLDALLPMLGAIPRRVRLVYTGGCWLHGQTGARIATETTPFDPPARVRLVGADHRTCAWSAGNRCADHSSRHGLYP